MNSIPTICVLTLIRHDLLKRLIKSIDYYVDHFIVLFQGGHNNFNFDSVQNSYIKKMTFINVDFNIGCSRGWNYLIENFPSPYWLICGDDTFFESGTLKNIYDFMADEKNNDVLWCCFNEKDKNNLVVTTSNFSSFIFTKRMYDNVGLFDENIYPAYYEDSDLWHRLVKTNLRKEIIPNAFIFSGDDNHNFSCSYFSLNSSYKEKMDLCRKNNEQYYFDKWNNGDFSTPFNSNYLLTDKITHENYYKNQEILVGHRNEPSFSILKVIKS